MPRLIFVFLLIPILSYSQCESDIDSIRKAIFHIHRDNIKLHDSLFVVSKKLENMRVDNLIINRAGGHFVMAGASGLVSVLFAVGGSYFWIIGDKPVAWGLYAVSGGFLTLGSYQLYFGGEKMGWVGKGYYVVEERKNSYYSSVH